MHHRGLFQCVMLGVMAIVVFLTVFAPPPKTTTDQVLAEKMLVAAADRPSFIRHCVEDRLAAYGRHQAPDYLQKVPEEQILITARLSCACHGDGLKIGFDAQARVIARAALLASVAVEDSTDLPHLISYIATQKLSQPKLDALKTEMQQGLQKMKVFLNAYCPEYQLL